MKAPYYKGKKRAKRFSQKKQDHPKFWGSVFESFEWSKNRKKIFLLQITQNGPIRENKWF